MNKIVFSIIMPSYNSEKTIEYSLKSIAEQTIDLSTIECLVIDGGSGDRTRDIAESFPFVRILDNEKRLPEYAKIIGFQEARGKYLIKMDSDEAFSSPDALAERKSAFEHFTDAHILLADELVPYGSGFSDSYLNYCGDPFSFFIYRPKRTVLESYIKNIAKSFNGANLLEFTADQRKPIADGGTTTVDLSYIKESDIAVNSISSLSNLSDRIFSLSNSCICIKGDSVIHRTRSSIKEYLKKIKFRIVNNVFSPSESGFSNRNVSRERKKYLFPLYVLSFILPLYDSFYLSLYYKD
ncbi:MAG: glycosyltransferase family 2 protein, partial [Clostridiales bacterium]|nr:glycosyltransferase family 2 protein [Clostridiales bacterium]